MLSAYGPHFVDVKHGLSTPYTLSNLSRWGLHSKKVGEICQAIPASLTPTLTSYLYQDFGTEGKHDSPQAIQLCYVSYVNIDSHYQLAQELIFCPYSRIAWNLLLNDLQDLRRFFNMVDPTKKYKKCVFLHKSRLFRCFLGGYLLGVLSAQCPSRTDPGPVQLWWSDWFWKRRCCAQRVTSGFTKVSYGTNHKIMLWKIPQVL